jgi:uncharacterized protein YciI
MRFVNYARYVNDERTVSSIRPRHREYMSRLLEKGKLVAGGPFTDGSGALFIYEADSLQAATAIVSGDPYLAGGALASYELRSWEIVSANPDLLRPQMRTITEGAGMHGAPAMSPTPVARASDAS